MNKVRTQLLQKKSGSSSPGLDVKMYPSDVRLDNKKIFVHQILRPYI